MAVGRPFWKGYLKLSLVSCAIAMFPASSMGERVSFRQINKKTGHRLKQQLVDAETGEVVESQDKGRGYEIGKNEYLPVEDEELDNLALESTHTIEIEKFVDRSEIDERYLDSPYYLAPDNKVGQDAFAVIREAMKRKHMVGLGRVVLSRRERIVMLEPFDKGLVATTLRYAYEVRDAAPYFEDIPAIKLPGEMVELAEHILETKAGTFDPAEFQDRYEAAVVEMLKQKQAGLPPNKEAPSAPPSKVINLMDALRRSVEGERLSPKKAKRASGAADRRTAKGARKAS
jgi:DNA end-binding protein Ku